MSTQPLAIAPSSLPAGCISVAVPAPHGNKVLRQSPALLFCLALGLVMRILFAVCIPEMGGDGSHYEQLAWNLSSNLTYSTSREPPYVPSISKAPGYPLFMAIVFVTAGRNHQAVRLAQALLDALTVVVIYLTAQRVSRLSSPVVPALLAAMIPFTGIYVRFLLSEVLSIFLTAVLMFFVVHTVRSPRVSSFGAIGLCLGFLILVRPDFALFPLVLISVFIVFWYMNRRLLLTAIALTTIGTGVVLAPWIVRNARAFGGFPSLAAVGGVDGVQPLGFLAWIRTWHGDLVERDQVVWPYWRRDWDRLVLPDAAFSSSSERARVQGIMWRARVARSVAEQRSVDDDFAQLARERTQLHPFRVWISLPARRAVRLWLNSRTEAFPLPSMSNVLNAPFSGVALLKMFLALTNVGLILLAIVGVWAFRHDAVIVTVLAAFVLYRTVFHAYWAGMEPRYVLQAFPAIYILAGEGAGWLVRRFTPFEKRS